jgi:hypothetical protein
MKFTNFTEEMMTNEKKKVKNELKKFDVSF